MVVGLESLGTVEAQRQVETGRANDGRSFLKGYRT
jgi:hypothetical protein